MSNSQDAVQLSILLLYCHTVAMQYFLFVFLVFCIIIDAAFALEDFADNGLFGLDVDDSRALVLGTSSNLIPGYNPAENLDLFSSSELDELDVDIFAADCSATNNLVTRDEKLLCPTNEPKLPQLPATIPSDKPQNSPNRFPLLIDPALTGDDGICPPEFRFHLCCICNGIFHYDFCQDCLSSKPPSHQFMPAIGKSCKGKRFEKVQTLLSAKIILKCLTQ